ncbi:MAG: gas vesicle protein GvpG [Nocardioidaceae bacterium]
MGLLTGLLTLPLAPVRGTVWIADQVLRQAEQEYYDPATIRRQLEEVDELRAQDAIAEEDADELEEQLIQRLMDGRARHTYLEG